MQKTVKLSRAYTRDELLSIMQTRTWSAGAPFAAKISGVTPIIAFPALDENHQLWLNIPDGSIVNRIKPTDTVYITYGQQARDFGEAMARNMVGAQLGIIGSFMSKFSPNEKAVKQQVLTLVEELKNSGL